MNGRNVRRSGRTAAGASANDMARTLAAEGRGRRAALLAGVVLVVLVAVWLLTGSARAGIGLGMVCGAALWWWLGRRRTAAAQWQMGAKGERSTGRLLRPLERRGYRILHDRALDRAGDTANLDHLLIGPGGVIVVDSKRWGKNVMVKHSRRGWYIGRMHAEKAIRGAALGRRRVSAGLALDTGIEVTALAVLAIHGAHLPTWRRPEVEGIPLLRARDVRRWVERLPVVLTDEQVERLAAAAARRFPPYLRPAEGADGAAAGEGQNRPSTSR